ncbi:MAG: translation initiation factor IF-3 [bacterium]|nr:translation initiation factor IF-3 [bacterium]
MKPRLYRLKDLRINESIRIPKLRLVDSDGKQLGVVSRDEALRIAAEKGLDLVELVPNVYPPVCKIMDYGKYKYEQSKSEKHKHRVMQTKEIKLGLETQEADIRVKLKHAEKFLTRGDKVRIRLKFRGREIMYAERGKELIWNFAKSLDSISTIEQAPTIDGKIATALLVPKRSRDAKVKDK